MKRQAPSSPPRTITFMSQTASRSTRSNPPAVARVITPNGNDNDTAVLKLIPLTKEECQARFDRRTSSQSNVTASHRPIVLKLSHVQNLDDDDVSIGVIHARKFQDGSVAASVLLGRNETTGIRETSVSRALCEVSFSRAETSASGNSDRAKDNGGGLVAYLSMRKAPSHHAVHIDGVEVRQPLGRTVPIKDGSIISLWGKVGYAYMIQICNEDNEKQSSLKRKATAPPSSMAAPPSSPKKRSSPHQEIRKRGHQLMVGEQTCALCMDILIKSTFAYPCGHAFCAECTENCNNTCPNCRGTVQGWMPARSYDTIIWATALQGCFDPDDAKAYLERRKESGEKDPTTEERECILGSNAKTGDNGYYVPSRLKSNTLTTLPPIGHASVMNNGNGQKMGGSAADAICLDSP